MSDHTKTIPVTSQREDIVSIKIEGLKMFIHYESGQVCEYRFEFKGGSL